jgi:hypothetical protein
VTTKRDRCTTCGTLAELDACRQCSACATTALHAAESAAVLALDVIAAAVDAALQGGTPPEDVMRVVAERVELGNHSVSTESCAELHERMLRFYGD